MTWPYLRPLVLPRAVKAHRAVQSLQSERSFVRSRASSHVIPNKSRYFLIVEVHDTLGRPLFFLKSEGIQSIACRAVLFKSVRYTWPNHLIRRSLQSYDWLHTFLSSCFTCEWNKNSAFCCCLPPGFCTVVWRLMAHCHQSTCSCCLTDVAGESGAPGAGREGGGTAEIALTADERQAE